MGMNATGDNLKYYSRLSERSINDLMNEKDFLFRCYIQPSYSDGLLSVLTSTQGEPAMSEPVPRPDAGDSESAH